MRLHFAPLLACALIIAGCASGPTFIDQMEPDAVANAVRRGQFEFNCPDASGEVLNRATIQSPTAGGPLKAHYTIGVSGCRKRASFSVLCSQNDNQCVDLGR